MPGSPMSPVSHHMSIMRHASTSSTSSDVPHFVTPPLPSNSASEHDRLLAAVKNIGAGRQEEVTALLMSLPKKDRALCLFNTEILAIKVADAQNVLDAQAEDSKDGDELVKKATGISLQDPLAKMAPSTIPEIAALPASEIVELIASDNPPVLAAAPSASVIASTDAFMDTLQSKSSNDQKQKLGEKLVRNVLIASCILANFIAYSSRLSSLLALSNLPKSRFTYSTMKSLDLWVSDFHHEIIGLSCSEAHLMNEQPEILKEKVSQSRLPKPQKGI